MNVFFKTDHLSSSIIPRNSNECRSSLYTVPGCKDVYGRVRCEYYAHIGWCDKHTKIREKCKDTCVCNVAPTEKPKPRNCESSEFGCCWDNKTSKRDKIGNGCPGIIISPIFRSDSRLFTPFFMAIIPSYRLC